MPCYEHVFLARQDLAIAQVDALAQNLTDIVEQGGGKVVKTEYWGLKSIAYRIKKNRKAHYVMLNIEAPAPALAEMERNVGLSEDIIRFMTVRVEALEEGPSAMMRKSDRPERSERPERGERGERPERGERYERPERAEREGSAGTPQNRGPRGPRGPRRD